MNVVIKKSDKNTDKDLEFKLGDTVAKYGKQVNITMSQYAIAEDSDMLDVEVVQFNGNEKETVKEDIMASIIMEEVDIFDVVMNQINSKMAQISGQEPEIESVASASLEVYKEVKKRLYESSISGGESGVKVEVKN